MNYENLMKAVKLISKRVLTPVIYMSEHEDWIEFICFCDGKITMQQIYDTEQEVKSILNTDVEIIDIREFSESERIDIINQCQLIHSEDPIIEKIFAASMATDYKNFMDKKRNMLDRCRECGTYFVQ